MKVLVLVESDAEGVVEVSLEALTVARGIGDVEALVVGDADGSAVTRLGEYGAGRVVTTRGPGLAPYAAAAWAAAVVAAVDDHDVVMAAGTPRGNEVMAHVACRLRTAMAANVVTVDSTEPLRVSRQVLGGAALEEMQLTGGAVLTVAGHACEPVPAAEPVTPSVVPLDVQVDAADLRGRVVRTQEAEADLSGNLKSAKVVVGAGRGAGGADGFKELIELADLVGGTIGVSRVVTSLGWRPHHEQVGQTGSRISPDVYIPCGISGAIQHWAGCSSAKTILAVNTDPDAPMVTKAHYAVIGDLHQVVPAINEEIRRRRG
jgi:electron transfer flavoprotein alpha subunit